MKNSDFLPLSQNPPSAREAKRKPKIGFVFLVEDYQVWHVVTFAAAMHKIGWAQTISFFNHPKTEAKLRRLYDFLGVKNPQIEKLKRPFYTDLLNAVGANDPAKKRVLAANKRKLADCDVLIGTENTLTLLQDFNIKVPPMIMNDHGAMGGCKVIDEALRRRFDKIFFDSEKSALPCLKRGSIRPDQIAITGYPKIELCDALAAQNPFKPEKKFILYNAHTRKEMCSLQKFLFPLAKTVSALGTHDLIVAPHAKFQDMKLSRRYWLLKKLQWQKLPGVKVDMTSRRLIDMSYTRHAALYIGDISSQIYEFLRFLRPCIFLNPHHIAWENDPDLAFWHCGEVISDPEELEAAIKRAPALHEKFLPAQKALMKGLFSQEEIPPSERSVRALKDFLIERGILD